MHSKFFAGLAACAVSLTMTVSSALAGTITVTDTLALPFLAGLNS